MKSPAISCNDGTFLLKTLFLLGMKGGFSAKNLLGFQQFLNALGELF